MSKTFRRVSAVVVTTLGLSVFTGVAANAAVGNFTVVTAQAVPAPANGAAATATQVAGANNFAQFDIEVAAVNYVLTVSGGTTTCANQADDTAGATFTGNGTASVGIVATEAGFVRCTTPTTAAGTITASLFGFTDGVQNATATSKITLTVVAALSGTVYASSSVAVTTPGAAARIVVDADGGKTYYAPFTRDVEEEIFTFTVTQKDAAGAPLNDASAKVITAQLSGAAGSLSVDGASAVGSYGTDTADAVVPVHVYADGRAGAGVLDISVNGVAVAKYTINFYNTAAASYSVTHSKKYIGASETTGVFSVKALDANGLPVPGASVFGISGTTATATIQSDAFTTSAFTCANTDACTPTEFAAVGKASITVTGVAKGTSNIKFQNAASTGTPTVTSTESLLTVSGTQVAGLTWAFDKTSYVPGEEATITFTVTDSDSKPVADGTYEVFAAAPAASLNAQGFSAVTSASLTTVSGSASWTFFMPVTQGTLKVSATTASTAVLAAALRGLEVSTSAASAADNSAVEAAADAAAEAIDAANAATDAANLAAEAADAATVAAEEARDAADAATAAVEELATQVATLMAALKAQITTLANTVAKIAKKVRA